MADETPPPAENSPAEAAPSTEEKVEAAPAKKINKIYIIIGAVVAVLAITIGILFL